MRSLNGGTPRGPGGATRLSGKARLDRELELLTKQCPVDVFLVRFNHRIWTNVVVRHAASVTGIV